MLRRTLRRFIADKVTAGGGCLGGAGLRAARNPARDGIAGSARHALCAEYGGSGLDTLANAVLAEELGRSTYGGFAVTVLVHTDMASPHLFHGGTQEQLKRWMPDITAGRKITAVAMTEPDAGSDLASMRTTARKVAGGYVLNGSKMFITNGVHGDLIFVAAKAGDAGRNHTHEHVRRREGHAGLQGRARAEEARLALQRHGRARLRGLLRAGREPAGRGGPRLLRAGEEPAERAHRARRPGARRGHEGHRAHARLGQAAPRLRGAAVGQAGHPAAPFHAARRRSRRHARCCSTPPGATPSRRTSPRRCRCSRRWPARSSTR